MTTGEMFASARWTRLLVCLALPVVLGSAQGRGTPQPHGGWLGLALSCGGCEQGQGGDAPLIVRGVAPGGPAERVLRAGDTIVTVNRTITDARRMREALLNTPVDSALVFEVRGTRGRYTVNLRKQAGRLRQVGATALPLKYEGAIGDVGVEVLTASAPVVSRDSTGALLIRIGEHAVRLRPTAR